ncbi:hypothetical protein [Tannerella sp.]|uniref:hypothetical protein n=1 Tax=Tannerella sp. TaxID=2382127 RepID=UPI0026DB5AEA|nr:hypothetical protein [Tannerella sp.]MDO4703755.1 hypothetical protein [Tannerella sp.]
MKKTGLTHQNPIENRMMPDEDNRRTSLMSRAKISVCRRKAWRIARRFPDIGGKLSEVREDLRPSMESLASRTKNSVHRRKA